MQKLSTAPQGGPHPPPSYDVAGVGIGPFNLALAALADPLDLKAVFFDERAEFSWHDGMLIEGTTLQVPFLADLVTLVDPTSRWSYLSYLREHDRLFPFYFTERFHMPRREYDAYCRWVASSLPSCRFGRPVSSVEWSDGVFVIRAGDETVRARNVVLAVGTEPVIPPPFRHLLGKDVCHSADYLSNRPALTRDHDSWITVVGSGQSGAEVFLDLLTDQPEHGRPLRWLTRAPAFAPMEYSKLGLEHFTPDYTRYFRGLPEPVRSRLVPAQWQLYKAISADTISQIYDLLYDRSAAGGAQAEIMPNVEVREAARVSGGLAVECHQVEQDRPLLVETGAVVLATGYAPRTPAFIDRSLIDRDEQGRYRVSGDYRVALRPGVTGGLYVQNAELHTHGVGAPDLGLGAHRAAVILNAITGGSAYRLPERTAFTTFGVP